MLEFQLDGHGLAHERTPSIVLGDGSLERQPLRELWHAVFAAKRHHQIDVARAGGGAATFDWLLQEIETERSAMVRHSGFGIMPSFRSDKLPR